MCALFDLRFPLSAHIWRLLRAAVVSTALRRRDGYHSDPEA